MPIPNTKPKTKPCDMCGKTTPIGDAHGWMLIDRVADNHTVEDAIVCDPCNGKLWNAILEALPHRERNRLKIEL